MLSSTAQGDGTPTAASGRGIPGRGEHRNCGAETENTGNSKSFGLSRFLMASGGGSGKGCLKCSKGSLHGPAQELDIIVGSRECRGCMQEFR